MKRCQMFFVTLCGLAVIFAASANAVVPQTISYQGRLTDAAGDPVPNVPILVKFTIWDDPGSGTMLWNSGFQSVTPTDGLFTYPLGSMVNLPDNLFTDTIRYLGITIGADPELTPRERFRTVPYAYHALRTDTAGISATVFDGAITGVKLAANSVKSVHIVDGTITSADISNGTITVADMAANSVGAAQIQSNAVGNSEMNNNAIGSAEVIDNSLTAADLAANSVGTSEVADNTLTANDLAANSVGASEIQSSAVGASELATGSVVGGIGGDILDNTIHNADILNGTILGADIASNTITGGNIATGSIFGSDIATGTITGADIQSSSIFDIDLGDEPGVAQRASSTSINLTGPVQSLVSRILTAPTSGFVLAIATFEVSITHFSGTSSEADFGVSTSSTAFPFAGARKWRISNLQPTGTREEVITVSRMFVVNSGSTTFHLLGDKISGGANHNVDEMTLSLAFFPTQYGTFSVSPPSPPGDSDENELGNETLEDLQTKQLDK